MTTTPHMDVVCLGESMVTFLPSRPGPLADVPSFDRAIGGAESNVACTLARAGHRARWVSRVGADGFGDHLARTIAAQGVDTSSVQRDPARPTGIYFRTDGERATGMEGAQEPLAEVVYYRAGSAASAMSPATVDRAAVTAGGFLHLTGITAALSESCLALTRSLVESGAADRPTVSFDVNYRVGLWRDRRREEGPRVLLDLARRSDLVFVGEDEAAAAWGVRGGPEAVREALPEPRALVVKQGGAGATAFTGEERTFVPAPRVEVASPVGAGDAFAAGYLSATLRGLPVPDRLRHGHLMAAAALVEPGDLGAPPPRAYADGLVALDDGAWERLRLGPGWTTVPGPEERTPPEVRSA